MKTRTVFSAMLAFLLVALLAPIQVLASDTDAVDNAYKQWREALVSGKSDPVLRLYDPKAVLLATFEPEPLVGHDPIRIYFDGLTALPGLAVKPQKNIVRLFGDTAVNSGTYEFSYGKDGTVVTIPARFSFTYKRDGDAWKIVDHHSSQLPKK